MQILQYLETTGNNPFAIWFDGLDPQAAAKVTIGVSRLEQGNLSNAKSVGGGVLEYRIDFGPGYRIYFGCEGEMIIILLAGVPRDGNGRTLRRHTDDGTTTSDDETRDHEMALTRSFKETVKARAERDAEFRAALFTEAVEQMLAGDMDTGKAVLRDYINATIGFERLARETGTPAKSLMRMFGPKGNPRAGNLFAVISRLQKASRVRLAVAAGR
jgi:putative addiction module killer protein